MIDQLRGQNPQVLTSQTSKEISSFSEKDIPNLKSTLKSLHETVEKTHSKACQLQNKIDLFSHTFTPKELPRGWHKVFEYVKGVMISHDLSIELDDFGKRVIKGERNYATALIGGKVQTILNQAHEAIGFHTRQLLRELKQTDAELSSLADRITQIENFLEKTEKKIAREKASTWIGWIKHQWQTCYHLIAKFFSFLYGVFTFRWLRKKSIFSNS